MVISIPCQQLVVQWLPWLSQRGLPTATGAIMFHRPGEVAPWLAVCAIVDFVQASEQVRGQYCSCQRRPRVGRRRGGVLLHPLAAQAPRQKPYSRRVSGLLRRDLRR